ncbi:alpha/beta fold hydrolase [Pantoea sp. Sc1]|uniref:alpha/beta fold hydrolase n=1 Tax=Pantoea sp. Sc1 TaxID=593105 RepID=UPI0002587969|nr:alpha/beta fold hydrolase [Pantoea sp. Sc1]EIB96327.1 hypothetical protein S7A_20594 [Pantoea sp. Sc1]
MFSPLSSAAGLSPLAFHDECVLLSTWSGALSELDINAKKLTQARYEFFFKSSLFTITQTDATESLPTQILISGKAALELLLPYSIGDFSVLIDGDNFSLLLYDEDEVLQLALNWTRYEESIQSVTSGFSAPLLAVPCGAVNVKDYYLVSLWDQTISYSGTQKTDNFVSLHCISANGILFGVEEKEAVHVRLLPFTQAESHDVCGEGVNCAGALMDVLRDEIIITEVVNGQHRLSFYDAKSCRLKSISDRLFGSITPLHAGNHVVYYVSGSIEGVQLLQQDFSSIACFLPGLSKHHRRYTEYFDVKAMSIETSSPAALNIIFLHGGPESCEWDSLRHYPLLKSMESEAVNFHIINYPGSAGFGREFRCIADQKVCEFTSKSVVSWIQTHLQTQPTIVMGWSFGGTLGLEILAHSDLHKQNIVGVTLINPLLDLPFHLKRVTDNGGDSAFFMRKFASDDFAAVTVERYADLIERSDSKILLIAGSNDEVLSSEPAQELIGRVSTSENHRFVMDDGAHGGAESFDAREENLITFVKQLLPLTKKNY